MTTLNNKYTLLEDLERREMLSKIASLAHNSNEFYDEVQMLIKKHQKQDASKIGLKEIIEL